MPTFYHWKNGQVQESRGVQVSRFGKKRRRALYQTGPGEKVVFGYADRKKARINHTDKLAREAHKRARDITGCTNRELRTLKPPMITFANWCRLICVLKRIPTSIPDNMDVEVEYEKTFNNTTHKSKTTETVHEMRRAIVQKTLDLDESALHKLHVFLKTL